MNNNFDKLIIESLIKSIDLFPDNNAFCISEKFYTYKHFDEYISKIRFSLGKLDKKELYFGIVVNDDIETYASIFALWLEGKAYVPLHPKQPFERNREIINQMGIGIILDSSDSSIYKKSTIIPTKALDGSSNILEINKDISEDLLAYILFTSGSTGKPKGVMISRKNVGAFMDSFWDTGIKINEYDKCLQTFDLTFDVSVQSFLTPLTRGACVYTIPHDQIKFSYVYGLLEDHQITFGAFAPSMLRYLKPYYDEIDLPNMKGCIVTAEASPMNLIREWQKCIPKAEIYNFYGPTEATIYCTYYKVKRKENKTLNGMLSIGYPLKNVNAIIIDDNQNLLQKGEKGELCVSGDHITSGYWDSPVKNEEAFFEKKFNGKKRKFYHTGDLCYEAEDNNLMLFGRKDAQVKIQGYRVELGEIEFHVREYLKGIEVVVMPFLNMSNNTELAIFIESSEIDENKFNDFLKSKLPSYMIPTKKVLVSQFPVNSSDKVDKKRLKKLLK